MLTLFLLLCYSLLTKATNTHEIQMGPLLKELAPFEIDHHLPTFPIPFTLPLNEQSANYLYFPASDSAADRDSSIMRCRALKGELYKVVNRVSAEREMLAYVIGGAVHVAYGDDGCWLMLPGGALVNGRDLCKRPFGSLCKLK